MKCMNYVWNIKNSISAILTNDQGISRLKYCEFTSFNTSGSIAGRWCIIRGQCQICLSLLFWVVVTSFGFSCMWPFPSAACHWRNSFLPQKKRLPDVFTSSHIRSLRLYIHSFIMMLSLHFYSTHISLTSCPACKCKCFQFIRCT